MSSVLLIALFACAPASPPPPSPPAVAASPAPKSEGTTSADGGTAVAAPEESGRPLEAAFVAHEDHVALSATPVAGGPGPKTTFGFYVLALTWEPNFCCSHSGKGQCTDLSAAFGATHLTIHGLWPNYTDAESAPHPSQTYPAFCGQYSACSSSGAASCNPDPTTIPADMATYGPGYVTDNDFLANHEWPKHGSCTGLDSATYFNAAITELKALPGDQGTPALLGDNIGKTVNLADLQAAFGEADAVLLSCDASCELQQVSVCLAHDADNVPTGLTPCSKNTTTTAYDNSCVLNRCTTVSLQAAGQCSTSGGTGGTGAGGTCGNPGQGPACTSDDTCTSAGFVRCAHSGCCTSVPL